MLRSLQGSKKKKMPDRIIVKSNRLVESKYSLTLREAKCILALISMINAYDEDLKEYEISMDLLKELIGPKKMDEEEKKWGDRFAVFRNIFVELKSKPLSIQYEGGVILTNWINDVDIQKYTGLIRYSFSPNLKPYLLKLKDNFTVYRLNEVMDLKSSYSLRLFELLVQYEKIGRRKFNLTDLRKMLGIEDSEYEMYGHFKSRVILPAQRELATRTQLSFDFEEIKQARKVVGIEFIIYPRKDRSITTVPDKAPFFTPPTDPDHPPLFEATTQTVSLTPVQHELLQLGLTPSQVLRIWQRGYDQVAPDLLADLQLDGLPDFDHYMAEKTLLLKEELRTNVLADPHTWLLKAIKQNWKESVADRQRRLNRLRQEEKQRQDLQKAQSELQRKALYQAELEAFDAWAAQNPEELERLLAEVRAETDFLNKMYNPQLSGLENYRSGSITFRPAVNEKLRLRRPELVALAHARVTAASATGVSA